MMIHASATLIIVCALLAACSPAPPPEDDRPSTRVYADTLPTSAAAVREFCAPPGPPSDGNDSQRQRQTGGTVIPSRVPGPGQLEVPMRCIIREPEQVEVLWKLGGSPEASAAVDLNGRILVVASGGSRGTDGNGIAIDSFWVVADTAVVWVADYSSGNGCEGPAVITYPVTAALLADVTEVQFRETPIPGTDCT